MCELLHTSNHHYFDGNNKGVLYQCRASPCLVSPHVAAYPPAGFIAPCLPTKTDKLPSGSQWLHEIKHDGLRTTMSFYAERFLPLLIDLSMRNKRLHPYRERTAGAAEGRVLDIGIGSGLNLPFYAQKAAEIFGLDPSLPLLARAQSKASRRQTPVHLIEGSAERIPLADRSMDTIVMTWTGCSIPEIFA